MDLANLQRIDPLAESDLKAVIRSDYLSAEGVTVMVISFQGVYRIGCQGGPDADFMRFIIGGALEIEYPQILLLDLRELDYQWGDNLEQVFDLGSEFPCGCGRGYAVILGPKCEPAVFTLINGVEPKPEDTLPEHFFQNIDDAWPFALKSLRSRRVKGCVYCSPSDMFQPPAAQP